MNINDVLLDVNTAIPCGLIINELVSNSFKHAFTDGREGVITIAIHPIEENEIELVVSSATRKFYSLRQPVRTCRFNAFFSI